MGMHQDDMPKFLKRFFNWEPSPGSNAELLLTFGYIAVFLAAVIAIYITANLVANWLLWNSDTLWQENFLRDILLRGVDIKSWLTPGAPNFFPDMLIYGLLRFSTGSVYWGGYIGFGIAKLACYAIAVYALLSLVTSLSRARKLWFTLACSSVILLGAILLGNQLGLHHIWDFAQLLLPSIHGGAIVDVLIAILLTIMWIRDSRRRTFWLLLLLLLSIPACLSDRLYTIWFSIPAVMSITVLIILRRIPWRQSLWIFGILLISDLIGRWIFLAIFPLQVVPYSLSFFAGLPRVISLYVGFFAAGFYPKLVLFSYICLLVLAVSGIVRTWKERNQLSPESSALPVGTEILFLLIYSASVAPATFMAMVLINRPEPQYLTAGNLLALSMWGFLLVLDRFGLDLWKKGWIHITFMGVTISVVGFLALSTSQPLKAISALPDPYSPLISCLDSHADEYQGGAGLADYWQARMINLFSRKGLIIDQAQGDPPSIYQLFSGNMMLVPKKHTFVLTNTPTNQQEILASDVMKVNGTPDAQFQCGGYPVLVYHRGIKVDYSTPVASNGCGIATYQESTSQSTGTKSCVQNVDLEVLPKQVGVVQTGELISTGQAGLLAYGPYLPLVAGDYHLIVHGTASKAATAWVDMVGNKGTIEYLRIPISTVPEGSPGVIAEGWIRIAVPVNDIEVRIYVGANDVVRISGYELIPAGQ